MPRENIPYIESVNDLIDPRARETVVGYKLKITKLLPNYLYLSGRVRSPNGSYIIDDFSRELSGPLHKRAAGYLAGDVLCYELTKRRIMKVLTKKRIRPTVFMWERFPRSDGRPRMIKRVPAVGIKIIKEYEVLERDKSPEEYEKIAKEYDIAIGICIGIKRKSL